MKLNKRKQGISLIVLVITIIVMIIIAAAIILALNSANLTSKTSWAQLSSDRASLQSEYAVILADIIAKDNTTDDNYIGLSIEDVRNNPEFQEWCRKVKNTNSLFTIYGDEETEKATPAEIEVRLKLTTKEIDAMGLTVADKKVKGYDWINIRVTNPYAENNWDIAYVCNNGKWEDTPITKGNKAEGDFVAKFYKQEDEMVDLTSLGLTNSNAYHIVIEGNGEMPVVIDTSTYTGSAWVKPALEWLIDLQTNGSSTKDPGVYAYTTKVIISEEIENIPGYFFNSSFIKEIEIADGVKSIGDYAFDDCSGLTNITIPESVTSIGRNAFSGCDSLTSITIPGSVTSIGDYAFNSCDSLTSITILGSVTSIGDYAFGGCESLTNITIPGSVTSIGNGAFNSCDSLTSITIPGSVTSIGNFAFVGCESLTNITIPGSVTSIGDSAFFNCDSLTSITIPGSVTSIEDYAFYGCDSLTNITIPGSVTSIGNFAFADSSGLTNITIPESVTSIGDHAFYNCDNLTDVYYEGTEEDWKKIVIGDSNEDLTSATIHYNSKIN